MTQRDVIRLVGASPMIDPLIVRCVADIEAEPVRWIWRGRIARGKVAMFAGHPGLGKSHVALDIAAIITSGGRWPVDGMQAEQSSALILSAEDDAGDTIRPRLQAAGADLTRCHVIEAAQEIGEGGKPRRRAFSLLDDLARLEALLLRIGDVAIIIIDPITAYLGKTDSHRNAEVRSVLAPLAEVAGRYGVAVLAVSHLRKNMDGEAVLQVTGSLAFVAAARAAYLVTRDPGDAKRRLLLPAKNNLSDDRTGYAYRIEAASLPNGIGTSRIAWDPELVAMTADEALLLGDRENGAAPPKRDAAMQWLAEMLTAGAVPVAELRRQSEAAGYSWSTIRRARDALGVPAEKTEFEGGWSWRLPQAVAPGAEIEL